MAIGGTVRSYGDTLINKRSSAGGTVARMLGGSPPSTGDIESMWNGIIGKSEFDPSGYKLDQSQANLERGMGEESRQGQQWLGGQLQAQIAGQGPTVAAQQAQFGIAQALRNAGTQAANARGVNRGMALRESMYAGQNAQEAANRDAAMMRASEQLNAMGQYGQLQSQQRAGDIQSRQTSLDAEKANQQAEMQRQGYQNETANQNAARKQKGFGSLMSSAGSIVGALSDIRAKESIEPIDGGSFAARLASVRKADDEELARRADVESNARIEAALASSNAGYGAQQAGMQQEAAAPAIEPEEQSGGGIGKILGGAMSQGGGMLSDQKSKERIRFLEGELYGRPRRELDQQNPYRTDYLSEAEQRVENGFDSKAALKGVRPYSFRYRPQYAEFMAEQASGMSPPVQKPLAALAAYDDARAPRPGVMAQDLEQTREGSKVVESTPIGKVLDMKRSVAFALANAADMNRRLAKLEGARK